MKKTTIISGLLLSTLLNAQTFSPDPNAGTVDIDTGFIFGGETVLVSDPSDVATVSPGSVACSASGLHADNSYWRSFDLVGLGEINITSIDIGIENATSGTGGTQPIIIRVHRIANGDDLPGAALTLVTESITTVSDLLGGVANFPIAANLDAATDDLVVEINTPDGQDAGHAFFIGSNDSVQNRDFYLSAADCGINAPTSVADIGFPDMHGIIVVNGFGNVPVELMNFSID